ncbi:hypothetical protein [Ruminococcus sp.]|uniref:hypothetical protein n=3 Tax=Ruminococcus TaxID=1263 RepID=UPI002E75DE25|nr:hypothetical protein [Ruminococcus sp.]MEE0023896.1 hypothetical protein [Ruminococcus sp.]
MIKEMIRQQLLTLHTCLVCKVLELYSDGTAKVQPCTMMQTAKGTVKQHVALDGVPILDQIRSTISVGKACVVVFAERDISAVRYAEFALPSASRHHSLSDGIIIGTIDGSGTVIPGESSAPLPSETATAKTSTNKKTNGTEVQVDVKVSRQSGNKLQAKSDGLFVAESPDTNTTYNISKDGSTLKLIGSDGSESSVAIPESKNTKYKLTKNGNTITLTGSDGTSSNVLDSDTKYWLGGYYNRVLTDGPTFVLDDSNGGSSIAHVPNTFTSPKTNIQFAIGRYENIGDGYKVILDLAFFAPNSFGYGMGTDISGYRDYPVIINSYITLHFGESSTKRFLVRIITSARSDMAIVPARAIVRQLDSASAYSNAKWQVFLGHTDDTVRKGLVTAIRICLNNGTCSDVTGIEAKTFTYLATSIIGDWIERPRVEINTYDITTTEIDTILELSSQNAPDVAFTGDYNDLSNKPTIPDISGKQDKFTAVTHNANTAVGSATKPVYVAANGVATPISHSVNADVPANAKFTDTTYSNATTSKPGLMSATDKTNLNANTLARHTHSNKATLDKLTDAQLTKLDGIDPDLYLPKAGGVMTGDIDMKANKRDILVGTHKANTSSGTPIACGTIDTDKKFDEMLPTMRSYIGTYHYKTSSAEAWYDMISVRHRNGHSDGSNWGMYIYAKLFGGNLQWNLNTNKNTWQGERTLLDSVNYTSYAAKSSHTHEMIVNNSKLIAGSNNAAQWCRLGTLTSFENFSTAVISVWSGDGANGNASQNSWFEIHIKDGWQSTQSTTKACGVTVYRTHCDKVKVKVIPTAHNTFTVWVYLPWAYWNGNYAVNGRYKTWTTDFTHQTAEPEGTGADTAYYDQAFLTSTVAKATEATVLAETAWTDVPETNISPRYGKNIKYLKSGNTVYVRGSISFSASLNNPCCGTMPSDLLPDDYQDHVFTAWNLLGGVPTAYPVVLAKDGKITLMNPTSTAQWFEAGRAYNFNFNYHIG